MSVVPKRPPRPSRPSSCHKDDDKDKLHSTDSHAWVSSANDDGKSSETFVAPSHAAVHFDATNTETEVAATVAQSEHEDVPPASSDISDMQPEVRPCEKTDTGVVSSPAKTTTPVKHATTAELKLRYSSKPRKAPPIPPPPSSTSKDTLPLSADGDGIGETLPVKDHDGKSESEACGNVQRDASPCNKCVSSSSPVSSANNMDSKSTSTTAPTSPAPLPAPANAPPSRAAAAAPAPSSTASGPVTPAHAPSTPAAAAAPAHAPPTPAHAAPTPAPAPPTPAHGPPSPIPASARSPAHAPATHASNPDSKPALKPKPITAVSRESISSEDSSCSSPSPRTVSRTLSGSEPSTSLAATVPPVYAVVNKSRTLRSTSAIDGDADNGGKPVENVGKPGDNIGKPGTSVTVARSKSAVPPKKPPRTFAHSEYMRLKSLTLPRRSSDLGNTGDYEDVSIPTNRHEEADVTAKTSEDSVDGDDKMQGMIHENTEPLTDAGGKVRRQQTDKLPAPPRPPPPSFTDGRSSGSSSKTSVAEANTAATCPSKMCSGNNRDSKSRRPEHSRPKPGGIRPSSGSDLADDDDDDDDIYAVPGDANSGSVVITTTQRSRLTCETAQTTLQRTV